MESLDIDEVRIALKELVLGFNGSTQNLNSCEEIKDGLSRMEEIDENFHRYNLIKMITSDIDRMLGPLIDKEILQVLIEDGAMERCSPKPSVEKAVGRIVETQSYKKLLSLFSNAVEVASKDLQQNFEAELLPSLLVVANGNRLDGSEGRAGRSYDGLKKFGGSRRTEILYSACDSPMDDSSSSHDTTMFLTNDSLAEIAKNLNRKNSLETRQTALRSLLMNTSVLDLPHAMWPPIREELLEILLNFSKVLWIQGLRIVARGLNSTSSPCAKEMFQILAETLAAQFSGSKDGKDDGKVHTGPINFSEGYAEKMLRAFRLMDEYLKQLHQKTSEKNTPDILKGLMVLLSKSRSTSLHLTPFQFLSLVDHAALWFTRLMHGNNTRNLMFQLLQEHKHLLSGCMQQCFEYASSSRNAKKPPDQPTAGERQTIELHSTMSSVVVVTGVIGHANGRDLFPVYRGFSKNRVTTHNAVLILFDIILASPHSAGLPGSTPTPCSVAMSGLGRLCEVEEASRACLCDAGVVGALLRPLEQWLADKTSEAGRLMQVLRACQVIASLTSTESGRRYLVYGNSSGGSARNADDKGSASLKIISTFVSESLTFDQDAKGQGRMIMRRILSQLLGTLKLPSGCCASIQFLASFQFHLSLKAAHALVSREIEALATPTPGSLEVDPRGSVDEKESLLEWEATLNDSLLNLLATPRGLGLVLETGMVRDCVAHMCSKYDRILQVKPSEKFSYWFIMSQVSSIPSGMGAMSDTGFTTLLINSLWSVLETNVDITPPSILPSSHSIPAPHRPWSPCAVDKFSARPFNGLASVICSFHSVAKVVVDQELPSKTCSSSGKFMPPQTLVGLIDRLMIVNTDFKIRSLYCYEQSHLCGLRLLNLLSCCLDTMLLLQGQYDIYKILLGCQKENVAYDSLDEIIIDSLSLMRNHILVRSYLIGGPSERNLPPTDLETNIPKQPIKMFSDYPVPECYLSKIRKCGSDSTLVVPSIRNLTGWSDFKKSTFDILSKSHTGLKDDFVMVMMEHALEHWLARKGDAPGNDVTNVPSSAARKYVFSRVQLEGMSLTIRYGKHLRMLNLSTKESLERLKSVVAKVSMALKKRYKADSKISGPEQNGSGFDWFLASVFLLTSGNSNRTVRFLTRASFVQLSVMYWAHHLQSVALSSDACTTEDNVAAMSCAVNHNFEVMLQNELPQVYSAFKLSGLAPGQILGHWTRQCLFNYLDWPQIQQYLTSCVCLGPDCSAYFCMAILKHLETKIKHQAAERNLIVFFREEPIRDFQLEPYLPFMQSLEQKYRQTMIVDVLAKLEQMKK